MAYKDRKTHKAKMSTVRDTKLVKLAIGFEFRCFNCSLQFPKDFIFDWQVEHVIPQIWFVENKQKINHELTNLALLCRECNASLGDKLVKPYAIDRKDELVKMQTACINASTTEVERVGKKFAEQSRKFCKSYKSGFYLKNFWKTED